MLKREGTRNGLTWVGRLAVMGGIAALTPLASIQAQVPRSEVAHPSEKGAGKGSDSEDREAIEKARAKVEELEEDAEVKYTEFKKAVRHLERAEERLAELRGRGGRPDHEAIRGFRGAGLEFRDGAGRNGGHEGAAGFETHGFGMPGAGMHPMARMHGPAMGINWMREIDAKLDRLRAEVEELRRDRDRGTQTGASRPSRREPRSTDTPAEPK